MQSEATMSIATLVRAALVGLALVVTAPSPVTFAAAVYENLDYGFVVTAPKGLSIGPDPESATNHIMALV
jgi:hypothetical protein